MAGDVVGAAGRVGVGAGGGHALPQRGRRVQDEELHVAVLGERSEHLQARGRQPRQAEQRDALR